MLTKIKEEKIFCGDINLRNMLLNNDINTLVLNDFDNKLCCSYKYINIQKCINFDSNMYILLTKFIIFINSKKCLVTNIKLFKYNNSDDLKPLFYDQLIKTFNNVNERNKFIEFIKFIIKYGTNIKNNQTAYLLNLLNEFAKSISLDNKLKSFLGITGDKNLMYIVTNKKYITKILDFYF